MMYDTKYVYNPDTVVMSVAVIEVAYVHAYASDKCMSGVGTPTIPTTTSSRVGVAVSVSSSSPPPSPSSLLPPPPLSLALLIAIHH